MATKYDWDEHHTLLDVILGYDCNLACDYCTITPEMRRRALPAQAVAAEMRTARAEGYDRVSLTGGEPTIRPELVGLVRHARSLGFEGIKVQSNGLLFSHEPNLRKLLDAGCNTLSISIHTHDQAAYDRLVRREGAWPLMVAGLKNAVASGACFQVDLIVKTGTVPRLLDAARWLHGLGVRRVDLWFVSLTDGNAGNLESMPRMTEALPAMREVFAFGRETGMRVRSLHVPRCLLAEDRAHAHDPGSDRVKVVTPDATFELKRSKLTGQAFVPVCEGCEHREICPGIREDYLARYGDAELVAAREGDG